jgi:hypothetical protein
MFIRALQDFINYITFLVAYMLYRQVITFVPPGPVTYQKDPRNRCKVFIHGPDSIAQLTPVVQITAVWYYYTHELIAIQVFTDPVKYRAYICISLVKSFSCAVHFYQQFSVFTQ